MFWFRCTRHPTRLVIHCAGNDIGKAHNTLKGLHEHIKFIASKIAKLLPKTIIVWSHILPHRNWSLCLKTNRQKDKN